MKTIFGEEHFLDNTMCEIAKAVDDEVINNIYKTSLKVGIKVNKDKLRRWLILCGQLENIDKSHLIDIAIKRKFDEKDHKNAVLERALSNVFRRAYFEELEELDDGMHIMTEKEYVEMHKKWAIDRAEKELKDEKL